MSFTEGIHLRVKKIVTTNGVTPELRNGQLVYKEHLMPITARPELDRLNKRLEGSMKMIIETVDPKRNPHIPQEKVIGNVFPALPTNQPQVPPPTPGLSVKDVQKLVNESVAAATNPILDALNKLLASQGKPVEQTSAATQVIPPIPPVSPIPPLPPLPALPKLGDVSDDDDDEDEDKVARNESLDPKVKSSTKKQTPNAKAATT